MGKTPGPGRGSKPVPETVRAVTLLLTSQRVRSGCEHRLLPFPHNPNQRTACTECGD